MTTTSEEARKFFLQGVSQIHSFWFQESERSCTQALELDPDMAMALLVHRAQRRQRLPPRVPAAARTEQRRRTRTPRRRASRAPTPSRASTSGAAIDPQIRAREAIAKAMALRDKVTPRERLYIEAQAARRAPGPKEAADAAYIAALRKLVAAYPGRSRSEVDARLAIDNGFEPVDQAAARAHDGSDRAARGGGRERRLRSSARTIT